MWNLQVGTADALAFYLPGVVSQMGKVLHASRTTISGAAGSTEALDQAVRGLAEYLGVVLGDGVSTSIRGVPLDDISGFCSSKEKPLVSFLEELRHLPVKNLMQDDVRDSTESVERGSMMSGGNKTLVNSDNKVGSLRVKRSVDWLANTTAHVNKLLSATFPHVGSTWLSLVIVCAIFHCQCLYLYETMFRFLFLQLCVHPSKKVRLGVLASVQALLCKCSYTLKESRLMLLVSWNSEC